MKRKNGISKLINCKKSIKIVVVVEDLFKGLLLEAVDENYVLELKKGMREYDGCSLGNLLKRLCKYAKMDNAVHTSIMDRFEEVPDMDLLINKHYTKQEECPRLVSDTNNLIIDATMVMQFTQHLAKTAELGKKVIKFKSKATNQRKWDNTKVFF